MAKRWILRGRSTVEICIGVDDERGGSGTSWSVKDFLLHHKSMVEREFGPGVVQEILAELRKQNAL